MIHFFSSNPYSKSVQSGNNFCQTFEICLHLGLASVTQAATNSAPSVAPVFQNVHPDVKMRSGDTIIGVLMTLIDPLMARFGKCDPSCNQFADICGPCVERTTVKPASPPSGYTSHHLVKNFKEIEIKYYLLTMSHVELPPTHSLTSPLLHRDPRGEI